jgi:hypothetical protein
MACRVGLNRIRKPRSNRLTNKGRVLLETEQLSDNGARHLVIASLELTCLDFQAQRADLFQADVRNLAELRDKLPNGLLAGRQVDRVVLPPSAFSGQALGRGKLGVIDAVCSRIL